MGGDPQAPTPNESMEQVLKAYQDNLPGFLQTANTNILPTERAKLQAAQATGPGYAALQQQLYDTFGPAMSATGSKILEDQALAQAATDSKVLAGPGKELITQALEAQKLADPEYYKTRELASNRLGDLLGSIDLSGGLSKGENESISRRLAQENQARGTAIAPSQTDVVSGALKFGQAGRQREVENKNLLNSALQTANQAIPAFKSGTDVFQVATGKPSQANPGDNKFVGANQNLGQDTFNSANNLLNNATQLQNTAMDVNSKRRDSLDRFNETFSSTIGSL